MTKQRDVIEVNAGALVQERLAPIVVGEVIGTNGERLSLVPVGPAHYVAIPRSNIRRRTAQARWVSKAIRLGIFYRDVAEHPKAKLDAKRGRLTNPAYS